MLENDSDPDGDALSVSVATGPASGNVILNADGTFTYTPNPGFYGTDSFTYTLTDADGGTDTATVTITVTLAGFVSPGTVPDGIDRTEVETAIRSPILADPVVYLVADAQDNLFTTPALMSDMNTTLGVSHPITTALKAIQTLGETPYLPIEGYTGSETLDAQGAVATAVNEIGFPAFFPSKAFGTNDLNDTLKRVFEAAREGDVADLTTTRGEVLSIVVDPSDGALALHGFFRTVAGEPLPIRAIDVTSDMAVSTDVHADGSASLAFGRWQEELNIAFSLANGQNVETSIALTEPGEHRDVALRINEISNETFSAQTGKLVFASDAEASKLLKAVRG